eukprot:3501233-Ditylum_brightwellii.AAC.1
MVVDPFSGGLTVEATEARIGHGGMAHLPTLCVPVLFAKGGIVSEGEQSVVFPLSEPNEGPTLMHICVHCAWKHLDVFI